MKRMNGLILRRMEQNSGKIMNVKDYEWDDIADADTLERPIKRLMKKRDNGGVQTLEDWKGSIPI